MRLTITGADGFVGRAVVRGLMADGFSPDDLTLVDRAFASPIAFHHIMGDLDDPAIVERTVASCDTLLHLAALPGGAAERDPALSERINLNVPLRLIEAMQGRRLLLSGSIAVFGAAPCGVVDDDTPLRPDSVYGAHKAIVEMAFTDAMRRGAINGALLRLPGIVARPASHAGFGSAWMSDVFTAARAGATLSIGVTADATAWMTSSRIAAANMVHAIVRDINYPRPFTLPALRVRVGDLLDAIANRTGPIHIDHREDAWTQRTFGGYPELQTPLADRLGFRHDGSLASMVDTVLEDLSLDGAPHVSAIHKVAPI